MAKDKSNKNNKDKERIINFGLLIQQRIGSKGVEYKIQSKNQGMSDAEIILIVEAWLEKVKKKFKDTMMGDFEFKNK